MFSAVGQPRRVEKPAAQDGHLEERHESGHSAQAAAAWHTAFPREVVFTTVVHCWRELGL